jgi:hypothetical protein
MHSHIQKFIIGINNILQIGSGCESDFKHKYQFKNVMMNYRINPAIWLNWNCFPVFTFQDETESSVNNRKG